MQDKNIPEYSVTAFNNAFRKIIFSNFEYIRIKGEVSEIKKSSKGQIYIIIKDESSVLSAVVWSNNINSLTIYPELGMEIIASGKITSWHKYKTTYQLDVDNIEDAGEGALLKIIEDRKKRLASKGFFDLKHKKSIPYLPKKIGIITSPTGSVIYDILNRLKDRFPIPVDLWPSLVQGKEAPENIIKAINGFNDSNYYNPPDVIIIARGGGSVEDLMAFNDEELTISVFKSKIPIISAIGHETDFTLVDYASDYRCPTPTAAAEKVVPVRENLIIQTINLDQRLNVSFKNNFIQIKKTLNNFSRLLKDPKTIVNDYINRFSRIENELSKTFLNLITNKKNLLLQISTNIKSPEYLFSLKKLEIINLVKNLNKQISYIYNANKIRLKNNSRFLLTSSVENNLKKGYVLIKNKNNILKRSTQINKEQHLKIRFFDDQINVKIKKI